MIYYGNFKWPSADFTNSTRTVQTQLYNNPRKRKVKDWTFGDFPTYSNVSIFHFLRQNGEKKIAGQNLSV